MNRHHVSTYGALALAGLLATAGCSDRRCCTWYPARTPVATQPPPSINGTVVEVAPAPSPIPFRTSGFLADYSRLTPGKHPGTWVWMKEGIDLRAYDNVHFDPIDLRFATGSAGAEITPEQREKVTNGFVKILTDRLTPYFPVLSAPAADTLSVRAALTDIHPSVTGTDAKEAQVGGATLEGEIRDSLTGTVYVAFVSRIEGSTRGETVKEEWRPVEGAFREWADRLLDFLELHAR